MFDLYQKKQIGDVTTFKRPYQTIALGPYNGQNSMRISEELVTILPDLSTTNVPTGEADLEAVITDPSQVFNVVDPTTGTVTGTMSFAQLKVQMYSLYLYLASLRDGG